MKIIKLITNGNEQPAQKKLLELYKTQDEAKTIFEKNEKDLTSGDLKTLRDLPNFGPFSEIYLKNVVGYKPKRGRPFVPAQTVAQKPVTQKTETTVTKTDSPKMNQTKILNLKKTITTAEKNLAVFQKSLNQAKTLLDTLAS